MGFQKRVDRAGTVLQGVAQGFASVRAGLDNLAQGDGFPRQLGADGPTEKAVVVKDANLGHIPGIIPNDDGEPGTRRGPTVLLHPEIQQGVVGLLDVIRPLCSAAVEQIKGGAIGFTPGVRQGH